MDKPHVKGVGDNVVKDAADNAMSPQRMRAERKLNEVKRTAHSEVGEIKGGGRLPARSAKNDPQFRDD
jgi:hypothetical protein